MKRKFLVKFEGDWADEISLQDCCILEAADIEDIEKLIEKVFAQGEFYFGSNEFLDAGEIDVSDFNITYITDEVAEVLTLGLGLNKPYNPTFGVGMCRHLID